MLHLHPIVICSSALTLTAIPAQDGPPGIPDGYRLVHGDILVPDTPLAGAWLPPTWTDGIVYFEFDPGVSDANKLLMYQAMDEWNYSGADVAFVPRTPGVNDDFYVLIEASSTSNFASIGMQGPAQSVTITSWGNRFIMAHELCHTLGFWHEQSRPDRDDFVEIVLDNVEEGHEFNFDMEPEWITLDTDYDFDSVMHYRGCAFTVCTLCLPGCETILVLPPNEGEQGNIGQRDHLSALDIQDMKDAYGTSPFGPRYMDSSAPPTAEVGSLRYPFRSFATAVIAPDNVEFWVRGGTYDEANQLTLSRPGTYRAHNGIVRIQ